MALIIVLISSSSGLDDQWEKSRTQVALFMLQFAVSLSFSVAFSFLAIIRVGKERKKNAQAFLSLIICHHFCRCCCLIDEYE